MKEARSELNQKDNFEEFFKEKRRRQKRREEAYAADPEGFTKRIASLYKLQKYKFKNKKNPSREKLFEDLKRLY